MVSGALIKQNVHRGTKKAICMWARIAEHARGRNNSEGRPCGSLGGGLIRGMHGDNGTRPAATVEPLNRVFRHSREDELQVGIVRRCPPRGRS